MVIFENLKIFEVCETKWLCHAVLEEFLKTNFKNNTVFTLKYRCEVSRQFPKAAAKRILSGLARSKNKNSRLCESVKFLVAIWGGSRIALLNNAEV